MEQSLFCRKGIIHYFCSPQKGKIATRGMVERFIAPVLKTGDPSRGPGVRIPLPLLK